MFTLPDVRLVCPASPPTESLRVHDFAGQEAAPVDEVMKSVGVASLSLLGCRKKKSANKRFKDKEVYLFPSDFASRVNDSLSETEMGINATVDLLYS
ncbi:MAG: hypothetical protein M3Q09_12100 [Gemmatimonadota bacterium]|nr:hypothetical protein [Gemmatimonadota bacterium]